MMNGGIAPRRHGFGFAVINWLTVLVPLASAAHAVAS